MKTRYLFFIFFIYPSIQLQAQHVPLLSQFELNKNLFNPAAFSDEQFNVNLFYRNQWLGFDDSPKTMGLNAIMKINTMNFGVFLINDKAGVFEQNTIHLNYAYDLQIVRHIMLSFGISGGIDLYAINYPELNLYQKDDPYIHTEKNNVALPDFNLGLMLHSKNDDANKVYSGKGQQSEFYVGISVQHILRVITLNEITRNNSYLSKHYNLIGGYFFPLNNEIGLGTNILLKYVKDVPFQADAGITVKYKKKFLAGLSYRSSNDIIMKLGFNISDNFLLAYSFDLLTSNIPDKTSHEFILAYKYNYKPILPVY
jgi:type IX secretion system PorP/SprF family membrane protein